MDKFPMLRLNFCLVLMFFLIAFSCDIERGTSLNDAEHTNDVNWNAPISGAIIAVTCAKGEEAQPKRYIKYLGPVQNSNCVIEVLQFLKEKPCGDTSAPSLEQGDCGFHACTWKLRAAMNEKLIEKTGTVQDKIFSDEILASELKGGKLLGAELTVLNPH